MNFQQSNKAIYLQIADRICDQILLGEYPTGGRLPSVRDHAAEMEVNANTMMRSYDYLQQQGLIFNKRGIGYFVADDAPINILETRRRYFMENQLEYFFRHLDMFGITPEALAESYSKFRENGCKLNDKSYESM